MEEKRMPVITRRDLLAGAAALGLTAGLSVESAKAQNRRFRFVHATDMHMQPTLGAEEGIRQAVRRILSLDPRPDFVLTGGDNISNGMSLSRADALAMFGKLEEAYKPLEMPVHHCIGNHDVYAWFSKDDAQRKEPDFGKKMFQDRFVRAPLYRAFDAGEWRFILLDSIAPAEGSYRGWIDDEQLQWLKGEVERVGRQRPILICTHIPLFTIYTQYAIGGVEATPANLIINNNRQVYEILKGYNVKAVLQGHTHVREECEYAGTRYITSGAVCGEWWTGPRLGVDPEGFSVFDVEGENLRWQYVSYGWKARSRPS
jgi:3',5'-cyclic AMP phosphodiesterase CpdA